MSHLDDAGNENAVSAAIDAAEEARDPLDGVVERTGTDPGAAFAPEVLERLVALKRDDRAGFEALRVKLKKAGCRVTGVDISEEGIQAGLTLARRDGLEDRVHFRRADVRDPLPFPDGAFSAIVCMDAMCHLPDRGRLLGECRRVLRPGGRMLYTDPVVVTGLVSNEKLATRSSTGYFEFCPPGVNERLIRQAGFELVRAEEVTENEVEVSRRWHAARQQRAAELVRLEGEETFAGLQRFLATVHRLTRERRMSRFLYLGRKPGG